MRPWGLVPLPVSAIVLVALLGAAAGAPAAAAPTTVVLITVDGARVDLLEHPAHIPFTSRLVREGRSLRFATAPTSVTFPATVSIMTGLYPDRSGVRDDYASPLGTAPATIAEAFRKAGWKTAAFPADCLCHASSGINRGFERFLVASSRMAENARADSAVAFLEQHRGAHTLVWIGFSLLAPQQPWERFRGSAAADSTAYFDRAAATDQAIGRLLAGVARVAPTRESLIVLVGTHGEAVPGWRPAGAPPDEDPPAGHGLDLSEAVLRVPLVLSGEGIGGNRAAVEPSQPEWVSTVDVFPTVASLAGVPLPGDLDGVSLRPMLEGGAAPVRPIFHELQLNRTLGWGSRVGVREGSVKLLSYGGAIALRQIDPRPGASETEAAEGAPASLRQALAQRFKLELRWPPEGTRDPAFGQEDEQMHLLAAARRRLSAGAAAEILDPLLTKFPDNGPVRVERGLLDVFGRRERVAAILLDSLRTNRPDYIEAEAAYADLLIQFDRTDVAIPRLANLTGWPMFEVDRLWRLGAAQVMAKEFDAATRTYERAETIGYPSDERLVRFRDESLQIELLEAEIAAYPDSTVHMIQLARVFGDLELYNACYTLLHRARGTAPRDAEPEYWLGYYLMQEGRAKHAATAFRRGLERDASRFDIRIALAYAEIAEGDDAGALADLRKAAAAGKTDATDDYNLACLLARTGAIEEAFGSLSNALGKGYSDRLLLKVDPDLEPLRRDPRFAKLIADPR
jgi:Flp pilus assembly protein TadD